jgi:cytochrome c biogenesis protein CcmG/thiol:disulfide interchange protein DsbE
MPGIAQVAARAALDSIATGAGDLTRRDSDRRDIGQEYQPMASPAGDGGSRSRRGARRGSSRSRVAWAIVVMALIGVSAVVLVNAGGQRGAPRVPLRTARNFSLPELGHGGRMLSLAEFTGRPVIINFFASWCVPCKRETPLLARFYRAHHGEVPVIGIDSNDQAEAALRFLAAAGVTYPVAVDAFPDPVALAYEIATLPQTFVLNRRHQIVAHVSGAVTPAELTTWASSLTSAGPG